MINNKTKTLRFGITQENWNVTLEYYNEEAPITSGTFEAPTSLLTKDQDINITERDIFNKWVKTLITRLDDGIFEGRVRIAGFVILTSNVQRLLKNTICAQIEWMQNNQFASLDVPNTIDSGGDHTISTGILAIDKALDSWCIDARRYIVATGIRPVFLQLTQPTQEPSQFLVSATGTFKEGLDINGNIIDSNFSVPNLYWNDKQDTSILINGIETDIENTINFIFNDYVPISDFESLGEQVDFNTEFITNNFNQDGVKLSATQQLTASIIYNNKVAKDYAQINEVIQVENNSQVRDADQDNQIKALEEKVDEVVNSLTTIWTGTSPDVDIIEEEGYTLLKYRVDDLPLITSINIKDQYRVFITLDGIPLDELKTYLGHWTSNIRNGTQYDTTFLYEGTNVILIIKSTEFTTTDNLLTRIDSTTPIQVLDTTIVSGVGNTEINGFVEVSFTQNPRDLTGSDNLNDPYGGTRLGTQRWVGGEVDGKTLFSDSVTKVGDITPYDKSETYSKTEVDTEVTFANARVVKNETFIRIVEVPLGQSPADEPDTLYLIEE